MSMIINYSIDDGWVITQIGEGAVINELKLDGDDMRELARIIKEAGF